MVLTAASLWSAPVKEVNGSVDVLINNKWQKATVGLDIPSGARIMTGAKSSVKVEVKGGFFIVKELSMVTFTEKAGDKVNEQKVDTKVGKVQVRFQKADASRYNFKVQTPVGTASVRGTEEIVTYTPSGGMTVEVLLGSIDVIDNPGNGFILFAGQNGGVDDVDGLTTGEDESDDKSGKNEHFQGDPGSGFTPDQLLGDIFGGLDIIQKFLNEPERL